MPVDEDVITAREESVGRWLVDAVPFTKVAVGEERSPPCPGLPSGVSWGQRRPQDRGQTDRGGRAGQEPKRGGVEVAPTPCLPLRMGRLRPRQGQGWTSHLMAGTFWALTVWITPGPPRTILAFTRGAVVGAELRSPLACL